jgi:acyl-CoA thioester hydrolase
MHGCFSMTRRVLFHETDLAGVMHFSNYFRVMEEVEHAWWRSLGLSVHQPAGDVAVSWPRVACRCEYAAPLRFEQEVTLWLRVTEVGEKSLSLTIDFCDGERRLARGKMRAVCCRLEPEGFCAIEIPQEIREQLEAARAASMPADSAKETNG